MSLKIIMPICFLLATINLEAKQIKLVAGPMQGHTTTSEIKVWIMVKNPGTVIMTLKSEDKQVYKLDQQTGVKGYKNYYPIIFHFKDLNAGTIYSWEFQSGEETVTGNTTLHTYEEEASGDFSFHLGSCAVRFAKWINWMHPGKEERIYDPMYEQKTDFMVWLGDNLYFRSKQMFDSYESQSGQYVKQRLLKKLNRFLTSRPQYAIWDDHDYGPNDSDGSFKYKEFSLRSFTSFWPNKSAGLKDHPGIFFSFTYKDADFFMTDNRYHRTGYKDDHAHYLGEKQLAWLKDALLKSTGTFKFIATGNQVLSPVNPGDSFIQYEKELNDLLAFIEDNDINGVIFLSGDRHHTELLKDQKRISYPLYEFTCSALTAITVNPKKSPELVNPVRIPGTLNFDHNYGIIRIEGPPGNRTCIIENYGDTGVKKWEHVILAKELHPKK